VSLHIELRRVDHELRRSYSPPEQDLGSLAAAKRGVLGLLRFGFLVRLVDDDEYLDEDLNRVPGPSLLLDGVSESVNLLPDLKSRERGSGKAKQRKREGRKKRKEEGIMST